MHYDELIKMISEMKTQDDGFVEEINKLSKRNAELTQENDKLKTKNDNLYEEINESYFKIKTYERQIRELESMLDNPEKTEFPDSSWRSWTHSKYRYSYGQQKAFAAFAIANDIPESTLHKFYEAVLKLEKEFDADEPSNAEINDSYLKIKEYEHKIHELEGMLTNATAKIDLLIESNGNHMNTIAVTDGESFGHKRDLMALEKKHNNLLESLEHLINCNVLNHALTTALNTEKGE